MKKILILIPILSAVLIFGFSKEVKAQLNENYKYLTAYYIEDNNQNNIVFYEAIHDAYTTGYIHVVEIYVDNFHVSNEYGILKIVQYPYYYADEFEWGYEYEIQEVDTNTTLMSFYKNGNMNTIIGGDNSLYVITFQEVNDWILGYNQARYEFGIYYQNQWLTASEWADIVLQDTIDYYEDIIANHLDEVSFDRGYDNGYDKGYDKGYDEGYDVGFDDGFAGDTGKAFLLNLHKWIVPAIIVVIILGGFVTIIQKRKDGET